MRIAFVLGSYKPGACGMSDYVNLLSGELEKKNISCGRISIDLSKALSFSSLADDLPEADLISLQFAPYAFSTNGLSGAGLQKFGRAVRQKNLHVMFHEIWIGAYPRATWREKCLGWRQKREILKFLDHSKPQTINATNCAALDRLKQQGVEANYLYMFGNIPFAPLCDDNLNKKHELKVAFFGTLYDSFPYPLLSRQLLSVSKTTRQAVRLLVLGRHREKSGLQALQNEADKHDFKLEITGELNSERLSHCFQESALGICTTPFDIMGKSGATAAMLEHGLPILAYDDGDTPAKNLFISEPFQDQVFLLNKEDKSELLIKFINKQTRPIFNGVSHVGEKMLEAIL